MEDKVKKTIRKWVEQCYGKSEGHNPSWNIEMLAKEITKLKFDFWREVERKYLATDCREVAEEAGIDLTDEEAEVVVDKFMNSEAYVDRHTDDWMWFIRGVKNGKH